MAKTEPVIISAKERLVIAGINEIEENGFQNFSLRSAARRCNLSSGAPYKHFRDKHELLVEIVRYINSKWSERQLVVLDGCARDAKTRLIELSMEYIRFLVENPQFRSIIMLSGDKLDEEQRQLRLELSPCVSNIVAEYCAEVGMPAEVEYRKLFVVRALIYGAALMFDNGGLTYGEQSLEMIRKMISREFEIS